MWQVLLFFLDSLNHDSEQLETTLEKNPQLIFNMLLIYVNRGKNTSSDISWCRFKWSFFLLFDDSWSATFLNSWNPWISPFLMLASSCNVNYSINTKTITAKTNIKNHWSKPGHYIFSSLVIKLLESFRTCLAFSWEVQKVHSKSKIEKVWFDFWLDLIVNWVLP